MKNRIRIIFFLITACILGINLFQGYWLYTTYAFHRQQFSRTATEALLIALQKQQDAEALQLFREVAPVRNGYLPPDTTLTRRIDHIMLFEETEERVSNRVSNRGPESDSVTELIRVMRYFPDEGEPLLLHVDTLTRRMTDQISNRISNRISRRWFSKPTFDLAQLDSAYRAELRLREVEARFRLDTLRLAAGRPVRRPLAGPPDAAFPVVLRPLPVNPVHHLFVQASFQPPVPYILRRMSWLLTGSVLLLLLTTGCFWYMLATILRQKKLSEIRNDFINNMTHELKTPLATVSAAIEAMQSFGALHDPQKTQLYLSISRNELQRLSDLVEKVLRMSMEERSELRLAPERVNVGELVGEIVARQQLKAPKPVSFEVDAPEAYAHVDRLHMGNAIHNLIDNAIKYSHEAVTIRVRSRTSPQGWTLSVQDNGPGIARGYQQAIFERFFRIPTGDLHQVKGFGLGLSYVRQVVEKHGGAVEVRSEPGRGAEFTLRLPGTVAPI